MADCAKEVVFRQGCKPQRALEKLGDKWTLLIIYALAGGRRRYSELQRDIEGVSQKMLTQTLRGMERDGFVARKVYAVVPPKVEYYLTPLGETLQGPVAAIRDWAEAHLDEMEEAQKHYAANAGNVE